MLTCYWCCHIVTLWHCDINVTVTCLDVYQLSGLAYWRHYCSVWECRATLTNSIVVECCCRFYSLFERVLFCCHVTVACSNAFIQSPLVRPWHVLAIFAYWTVISLGCRSSLNPLCSTLVAAWTCSDSNVDRIVGKVNWPSLCISSHLSLIWAQSFDWKICYWSEARPHAGGPKKLGVKAFESPVSAVSFRSSNSATTAEG